MCLWFDLYTGCFALKVSLICTTLQNKVYIAWLLIFSACTSPALSRDDFLRNKSSDSCWVTMTRQHFHPDSMTTSTDCSQTSCRVCQLLVTWLLKFHMTFANTTRLYIETTPLTLSILDMDVAFYTSLMFSNAHHALSQCNTRLRFLFVNNKYLFLWYLAPTMSGVTSPTKQEKEFVNLNLYTQLLL